MIDTKIVKVYDKSNYNIDELAFMAGLKSYDTALPQDWVDGVVEHMAKITGNVVFWPSGFVWSYDDSSFGGEPIPLTTWAAVICKLLTINPRNPAHLERLIHNG